MQLLSSRRIHKRERNLVTSKFVDSENFQCGSINPDGGIVSICKECIIQNLHCSVIFTKLSRIFITYLRVLNGIRIICLQ